MTTATTTRTERKENTTATRSLIELLSQPTIIKPMRHLLLALMIVLLPLRGGVGDAMATQMALGTTGSATHHMPGGTQPMSDAEDMVDHDHASGTESHASHSMAEQAPAQAMHDCNGHAGRDDQGTAESTATHDGPCNTCEACQACHTVALSPTPDLRGISFDTPTLAHDLLTSFTSASLALGQKPPIS